MKYIVTSYSYTDEGCQKFFDTLPLSGCKAIVFQYGDSPVKYPENCDVYKIKGGYKGNTARFLPIYDFFQQMPFKDDDWFIFTDTHDVWFQREIPDLNDFWAPIITSPEGKLFKEIDFWQDRLPQTMMEWPALNVGLFAMKKPAWMDFITAVRGCYEEMLNWYKGEHGNQWPKDSPLVRKYITATFNHYADTMIFNSFIHNRKWISAPEVFSCIGFQAELGHIHESKKHWLTETGEIVSVVHANGDVKFKKK